MESLTNDPLNAVHSTRSLRSDRRLLNVEVLKQKFAEQKLKQWWVAQQLDVHDRTVLRWVNGQVQAIRFSHVARLAVLLGCTVEDLTVSNA